MGTNRYYRAVSVISEEQGDDIAGEIDACDVAEVAVEVTSRALLDGVVTTSEAAEILEASRATLAASRLSLERSLAVQRHIDQVLMWLNGLPADAIARLSSPPHIVSDQALFRADAVCDADMRRRHPELGRVTIGQMLGHGDWPEAA